MKKLVIRNYKTGEAIKAVPLPVDKSVSFRVESGRLVIRDYNTGEKIKSVSVPPVSITFRAETV